MPRTSQARRTVCAPEFFKSSNDNTSTAPQHPPVVSTEQFLETVFGPGWESAWVCAKPAGSENAWAGRRYTAGYIRTDTDNYFAIGMLDPDATRRASDSVTAHHLFFADDVGTKVDPAKWDAMLAMGFPQPTFKIETSPGNETWGWVLDRPIGKDDAARVRALRVVREALGRLGLSDPLPDDARYIRLPSGVNSKQKYIEQHGTAPTVGLTEWAPDARASVEQVASVLVGPDWQDKDDADLGVRSGASHAGALLRTADLNNPDPIMQLGIELGMELKQVRGGVVEGNCPFIDEHTTRAETGFAFLGNGLMECSHAACQARHTPDFKRMMCEQYDEQQEARKALGLPLDGPATADEFLARAAFEYHDGKVGADTASVEAEAERVARDTDTVAKEAEQTQQAFTSAAIGPVAAFTPAQIPPRPFLYSSTILAGYIFGVVATGGAGKSLILMARAVALATGRELIAGEKPLRAMTVWYHNAEDDQNEGWRRLYAVMDHHGVRHSDLGGRLVLTSGRDLPVRLARMGREGPEIIPGVVDQIVETAQRLGAKVIMLDPLGAMHGLPENANEAMNFLAGVLREIAQRTGAAIVIAHHTGKVAAQDMDTAGAHASRGASAITDALRVVEQVRGMNAKEAGEFGVPEGERRNFMRIDNGKSNFAPAADARWLRRVSIKLHNGTPDYPAGDEAPTVEHWTPPAKIGGTTSDLAAVQAAIANAPIPPRAAENAKDWVGYLVAETLGRDAGAPGGRKEDRTPEQAADFARVKGMVTDWLRSGGLRRQEAYDPNSRKNYPAIVVGNPAVLVDPVEDQSE